MASKWGQSRIEVIALKDETRERLEAGHSLQSIYDDFRRAGQVNGRYSAFADNVKKLVRAGFSRSVGSSPTSAAPAAPSSPTSVPPAATARSTPSRPASFEFDPDTPLEDLV